MLLLQCDGSHQGWLSSLRELKWKEQSEFLSEIWKALQQINALHSGHEFQC